MRNVSEPPISVAIVSENANHRWREDLDEIRGIVVTSLPALDVEPGGSRRGDRVHRTLFLENIDEANTLSIETDITDPGIRSPETTLIQRVDGRIRGVSLQMQKPLRRVDGAAQGVRVMTGIALRIIEAALADTTERMRIDAMAASMTEAIGRRVCEVQGHADTSLVEVRLPSPFDLPGCRAWTGSSWEETLDVRHDAWRVVDAVSVILRRREDGMLLMHVSTAPTENPDPDLGPLESMRALAMLPPAPPPLRVTGDQTPL